MWCHGHPPPLLWRATRTSVFLLAVLLPVVLTASPSLATSPTPAHPPPTSPARPPATPLTSPTDGPAAPQAAPSAALFPNGVVSPLLRHQRLSHYAFHKPSTQLRWRGSRPPPPDHCHLSVETSPNGRHRE
eukprot:TRINITY_DN11747_c0_g1_i1.p3 TRINITY_DN11747_c0_g1~~TRINITY_DN11747_c0_g1_i1.p3  ORF type:complete len:131 (+),score=6.00 TRINITY_DN11747_c0_g1_i1:262-654(+)